MPETETELVAVDLDDYRHLVDDYREAVRITALWKGREHDLAEKLDKLIGDADMGTVGGAGVVRKVRTMTGERVDAKLLRERYPDIYTAVLSESKPRKAYLNLMR